MTRPTLPLAAAALLGIVLGCGERPGFDYCLSAEIRVQDDDTEYTDICLAYLRSEFENGLREHPDCKPIITDVSVVWFVCAQPRSPEHWYLNHDHGRAENSSASTSPPSSK